MLLLHTRGRFSGVALYTAAHPLFARALKAFRCTKARTRERENLGGSRSTSANRESLPACRGFDSIERSLLRIASSPFLQRIGGGGVMEGEERRIYGIACARSLLRGIAGGLSSWSGAAESMKICWDGWRVIFQDGCGRGWNLSIFSICSK